MSVAHAATDSATGPAGADAARDVSPARMAAAVSATVTRAAAFGVTLLVMARSGGAGLPVAVAAAIAVPYAASRLLLPAWATRYGLRRLATSADVLSAVALVVIALAYRETGATIGIGVLVGVLRGAADLAHETLISSGPQTADSPVRSTPMTRGGLLSGAALAGFAAAALAGWTGVVGAVWLAAALAAAAALMAVPDDPVVSVYVAAAADPDGTASGTSTPDGKVYRSVSLDSVVIPVQPGTAGGSASVSDTARQAIEEDTREVPLYRPLAMRRAGLRGTALAAVMSAAGQAGALALVFGWVREVVGHDTAFGLVAGALVAGACAGRLASLVSRSALAAAAAAGVGLAGAAGIVIGTTEIPAVTFPLALVAYLAGTVFAAPEPVGEIRVDVSGAPIEPVLPFNTAIALAFVGLPLSALVAAYVGRMPTVGGLLVAGLVFFVGVSWLLGQGGDQAAPRSEAAPVPIEPVAARLAGVATWVAVTLVYADGAWTVDVERKEGVSEGGHEVRSAEALRAIDILDLPGLREEIESALEADRERTEQETVRLREELTTVDARMAAIREMVAWSESWQANR